MFFDQPLSSQHEIVGFPRSNPGIVGSGGFRIQNLGYASSAIQKEMLSRFLSGIETGRIMTISKRQFKNKSYGDVPRAGFRWASFMKFYLYVFKIPTRKPVPQLICIAIKTAGNKNRYFHECSCLQVMIEAVRIYRE
jgi:hypothetical protein